MSAGSRRFKRDLDWKWSKDRVGKELEKFRINEGLRQRDLADQLGVSQTTIVSWEAGQTYPLTRLAALITIGALPDDVVKPKEGKKLHGVGSSALLFGGDALTQELVVLTREASRFLKYANKLLGEYLDTDTDTGYHDEHGEANE